MRHQGSPFPLAGELFAQSKIKPGGGVARPLAASAAAMFAEATRNRTCLHAPEVAHSYTTSKELLGFDVVFCCTLMYSNMICPRKGLRGLRRIHARTPERNLRNAPAQAGKTLPSESQIGASSKHPHAASHALPSVFAMWMQ